MKRRVLAMIALTIGLGLVLTVHHAAAHNPDPNDPMQQAIPVLKVADVAKAMAYYKDVLGFHEEFKVDDPPTYAGVGRGMVEFHLTTGEAGFGKGTVYLQAKGVNKLHEEFKSKGAEIKSPPTDRSYGMRDFTVKTPDGHLLTFGEPVEKK